MYFANEIHEEGSYSSFTIEIRTFVSMDMLSYITTFGVLISLNPKCTSFMSTVYKYIKQ